MSHKEQNCLCCWRAAVVVVAVLFGCLEYLWHGTVLVVSGFVWNRQYTRHHATRKSSTELFFRIGLLYRGMPLVSVGFLIWVEVRKRSKHDVCPHVTVPHHPAERTAVCDLVHASVCVLVRDGNGLRIKCAMCTCVFCVNPSMLFMCELSLVEWA